MELKVLGTVSPYCKDNKNCPGYLITHGQNKILLDCGEGISRLLNMPDDLNNLTIIISHLHKDHYSGLSGIAYASYVYYNLGYLNERIKVYIPKENIINGYSGGWSCPIPSDNQFPDYNYLMNYGKENLLKFIPYSKEDILNYEDMEISFSENPHQIKTYSIKVKTNDNTIVYSADTGFNNNTLEEFAKGADLFICESTFLRGQQKKNDHHLYAFEAALIAKSANVKELALTHF